MHTYIHSDYGVGVQSYHFDKADNMYVFVDGSNGTSGWTTDDGSLSLIYIYIYIYDVCTL